MKSIEAIGLAIGLWLSGSMWNAAQSDRETAVLSVWNPEIQGLPRPEVADVLALGYQAVLADFYWVGALQYFGSPGNGRIGYPQLGEYIRLVNRLAPDFEYAYIYGGMAIPWNLEGEWRNIDESVEVLTDGIHRFPSNWFLRLLLSYDLSTYLHRYRQAADQLMEAAKIEGSPAYFRPLAAKMLTEGGSLDQARALEAELEESSDPQVQEIMGQRKRETERAETERRLRSDVAAFKEKYGRVPSTIDELPQLERDSLPTGMAVDYDPNRGTVDLRFIDPSR